MKLARLACAVVGMAAGLLAMPAQAADPSLSLSLRVDWDGAVEFGSWVPYSITVHNDRASPFSGQVRLVPQGPLGATPSGTTYTAQVRVPGRGEGTVTIFALQTLSGPYFSAELRNATGRLVTSAQASVTTNRYPVGLLTGSAAAEAALRTLIGPPLAVSRFGPELPFPHDPLHLSGLRAVFITDFDSASLSSAQLHVLRDFVGFGGGLVLTGGSSWSRTLTGLPTELTPLRPSGISLSRLDAVADLGARQTDVEVPVAFGHLELGRVALATPEGVPLVVEARYGAGRVVQLTFDPSQVPVESSDLASLAWAQAASRAMGHGVAAPPGPNFTSPRLEAGLAHFELGIVKILHDTSSVLPPAALPAGLLIVYVLIAGLLNYWVLRKAGRPQLMWVTAPLIAVLLAGSAFAAIPGSRGSSFVDSEVAIMLPAPDGDLQAVSYHGVFAPSRGDHEVRLPEGTLVSTSPASWYPGGLDQNPTDHVIVGHPPALRLRRVRVWEMRSLQTLSIQRRPAYLEAHLRLDKGRVVGTVTNNGDGELTQLSLYVFPNLRADLLDKLRARASAVVNAPLETYPVQPSPGLTGQPGTLSKTARSELVAQAAASRFSSRPGQPALVGVTRPGPPLLIDGERPRQAAIAALAQPVQLERVDQVPQGWTYPRMVSTAITGSGFVNVYDIEVPPSPPGHLVLRYRPPYTPAAVEIYDWSQRSWRTPEAAADQPGSLELTAGESQSGLVRVRVREADQFKTALEVVSAANPEPAPV